MKKLLIVVLGLLVIAILALLLVPKMVNWNARLAAMVKASTGRDLRIDSPVQISVLPRLRFAMRGVHLSNAPGMKAPQMLSVGAISGTVRLWPLLARRVVIDQFIIQDPVLNLEVNSAGRANWVLTSEAAAPAKPEAKRTDGQTGLPIKGLSLGDVRLSQGRFSLIDATTGQQVVAKDVNLTVALARLSSPLTLALQMMLNDEPVKVDLALDSPRDVLQGTAATLQAAVVSKYVKTDYSGRVQQKPIPGLDGTFNLNIPSVGQLAAWLGRPLDTTQPDPGPLVVRAVFQGTDKTVALSEATITGKALKASATGRYDGSGKIAKLNLDINSDTLDIDRYLPPAPARPRTARSRPEKSVASRDIMTLFSNQPLDLSRLRHTDADVRIAIKGIKAMGYEIGQVGFTTVLKNGQLTAALNKLSLYGGNINGAVQLDASGPALGVEANLNIDGVKVDKLARAAAGGQLPVTGVASGNVKATAHGESPRRLIETLQGGMTLQLGGVDVKNAPIGAVSALKVNLDLPGIEKSPSLKGSVVYNKQRVDVELTTDPLRKVLSDDVFALQTAVDSKLIQLAYKGKVQQRPVPGLDGAFDLDIPSVGQLAAWVGRPLDKSQPDPGPLKLQAIFKGDGAKVALKRATLEGQALKATASGSYDGSGDIARITLKVESGVLDIDRYLPRPSAPQSVPAARPTTTPAAGNPLAGLSDAPFALDALRKTNADVQMDIAGIKAMGYRIDRIALTTTLKGGVLATDLRQVNLYHGNMKGAFKLDAATRNVGVNSRIDFKDINVGEVAKTALSGNLAGQGNASGHVQMDAQGASPRAMVENMRANLVLLLTGADIRLPQAGAVSELKMDVDVPGLAHPATLKGRVVYNKEALGLDLKLDSIQKALNRNPFAVTTGVTSQLFNVNYTGTLQQQPNLGLDGTLNLDVTSVARLLSWLDQPLAKEQPDPGPVKLRAVFEAKGQRAALKEATLTGKALQVKAAGQLDRRAATPVLNANIQVENADLNAYLPPPPAPQPVAKRQAPAGAKQEPATWSDEPLDLSALASADGNIDVKIDMLRYRELTIKPGQMTVKLQKGVLDASIDPLHVADGTVASKLHLNAAGKAASLDYQLAINDLEARPLLKSLADNDRLSGKTAFTFKGSAQGRSQRQLVSSLNGNGQFKFLDGAIYGVNIPAILRQAKSLGLSREAGETVKTDFAELSGSFVIKNGVLENRDLKMLAPLMRLSGSGQVPMPSRSIDYDLTANLVATLKGQGGQDALAGIPIPIKVSGPWDNIAYTVDWQTVFRDMAKDPERLRNLPEQLREASKNFGVNLPLPTLPGAGTGSKPIDQLEELQKKLLPGLLGTPTQPPPTQQKQSESTTTPAPTEEKKPPVVNPLKSLEGLFKR